MSMATESPVRDYLFLSENPDNPVSESTLHFKWGRLIAFAVEDTRAGTDDLVTGNVVFNGGDDVPRTAPDVMVIPRMRGREFRSYKPGPGEAVPSSAIEVRSNSNTDAEIARRARLLIGLGVGEYLVVDPELETVQEVTLTADSELGFRDVRGEYRERLGLMFVLTAGGSLGLCCPGDRVVTIDDNPYSMLRAEARRADQALTRTLQAERRAQESERRAEESEQRAAESERRAAALAIEIAQMRQRSLEPPS